MLHSAAIQDKFLVEIVESEKIKDFKSWCGQFYIKECNIFGDSSKEQNKIQHFNFYEVSLL
jgi:hypothetical protein